jgi:hypothetical protein
MFCNVAFFIANIYTTSLGLCLPRRNISTQDLSEVAIAGADSWLSVAASQYAFDGIHNFRKISIGNYIS